MNKNPLVDEYIAQFPENTRKKLTQLREFIIKNLPNGQEVISYKMPAYRLKKVVLFFAGYKNHIGLYPFPSGIEKFKDKITNYKYSKGAIQFPLDKELPFDLILEIIKFRVEEDKK